MICAPTRTSSWGCTPISKSVDFIPSILGTLYTQSPSLSMSTRPAYTERNHGIVKSIVVLPARAPTPTASCSWASGPMPAKPPLSETVCLRLARRSDSDTYR
eukprot:scaffold301_cov243-Pinguiococcus_pyrenoidosus.AAC.66